MDVLMEAGAAHYVPIHTSGRQRTDTLKEKINLTMSKLITWSKQVANGMDYLSSRNVIHGDLASRYKYQFGCGISKMVGPKKRDFCNVVTRFQGFHLIF